MTPASRARKPKQYPPLDDFLPLFHGDSVSWAKTGSVQDMLTWAHRLEALADWVPRKGISTLMPLMGNRRPYVFERNDQRWDDRLYHLVDRGYEEFAHVALSKEVLIELGFGHWGESRYCNGIGSGCYPVMDDVLYQVAKRDGLKRLARLLVGLARHVYEG